LQKKGKENIAIFLSILYSKAKGLHESSTHDTATTSRVELTLSALP